MATRGSHRDDGKRLGAGRLVAGVDGNQTRGRVATSRKSPPPLDRKAGKTAGKCSDAKRIRGTLDKTMGAELERLFKLNDSPVTTCAVQNMTWNKDREALARMLRRPGLGFDLEKRDNTGYTPLMSAVNLADVEMTQLLLEAKANANVFDESNRTAVQLCMLRCPKNRKVILGLLTAHGARFCDPCFRGACLGDINSVAGSTTSKRPPTPDAKDGDGRAPEAHPRAHAGAPGVRLKLKSGRPAAAHADKAAKRDNDSAVGGCAAALDGKRRSPASPEPAAHVVQSLFLKRDKGGHTVLHYAAANGQLEYLKAASKAFPRGLSSASNNGDTPALLAAKNGRLECLQWILKSSQSAGDATDKFGRNVLMCAARFGHTGLVRWLHESKADIDCQSRQDGETPLTCAAYGGHASCIRYLLQQGAWHDDTCRVPSQRLPGSPPKESLPPLDINEPSDDERDENGNPLRRALMPLLFYALEKGELAVSQWLHENGCSWENRLTRHLRHNAYMRAAVGGSIECLSWVARRNGASSVNATTVDGCAPLHYALVNDNLRATMMLLDLGACFRRDAQGNSAAHTAAKEGSLWCLQWLLERDPELLEDVNLNEQTPLLLAAERGQVATVQWLARHGANTGALDANKHSLLFTAAKAGNVDLLRWILDLRLGSLSDCDSVNRTPLIMAASCNKAKAVEFLLSRGADVNAKSICDLTALLWASWLGCNRTVKTLVEHKADIGAKSMSGETGLHLVAKIKHSSQTDLETARILLESGVMPDAKDSEGKTPAYIAARNGSLRILKHLFELGHASVDDVNRGVPILFAAAAWSKHLPTVQFLVSQGARLAVQLPRRAAPEQSPPSQRSSVAAAIGSLFRFVRRARGGAAEGNEGQRGGETEAKGGGGVDAALLHAVREDSVDIIAWLAGQGDDQEIEYAAYAQARSAAARSAIDKVLQQRTRSRLAELRLPLLPQPLDVIASYVSYGWGSESAASDSTRGVARAVEPWVLRGRRLYGAAEPASRTAPETSAAVARERSESEGTAEEDGDFFSALSGDDDDVFPEPG